MDNAPLMVTDNADCPPKTVIPLEDSLRYILPSNVFAKELFSPPPLFPASVKDGYAVFASYGTGHRVTGSRFTKAI